MYSQEKPLRLSYLVTLFLLSCQLAGWFATTPQHARSVKSVTANSGLATPSPTPAPGRVRGRVVYADTGRPVRHAGIYIEALDGETDDPAEGTPDIPHTVADLNGEFRFPKVPPGRYVVYANDGGLAQLANYPDSDLGWAERLRNGKITTECAQITVTAGQETVAEIVGRRSGALTGQVLYADGAPVAGAPVLALRRGDDGKLAIVSQGEADSRGVYRLAQLPGGEYFVAARDRDVETTRGPENQYGSGLMTGAYYPAERNSRKARPVMVPEGQDAAAIDVTLPDQQMHTVSGTVTLKVPGQPPLARARVSIVALEKEPGQPAQPTLFFAAQGSEGEYSAYSNAEGAWSIGGVPDGLYQIKIEASEAQTYPESDAKATHEPVRAVVRAGALSLTQEFTVKGADVADWRIELLKGGSLQTLVTVAKGVKMPEFVSLRAVRVDGDADAESEVGSCDASAEEPDCSFDGLVPGSYVLRANIGVEEDTVFYIKSITLKGQDITRTPIKISVGQTIKGVRVLLSDSLAAVSGKVLSDRKSKTPAARKSLLLMPVDALVRRLWGEPRTVVTQSDGSFSFGKIEPGEYFLFVPTPKTTFDEEFWRTHAAALPRLTLKPGANLKNYEVFSNDSAKP